MIAAGAVHRRRPGRVGGLVILAALLGLAAGPGSRAALAQSKGVASIEFLDIGQGDAVLIRSPEGKCALIDAGLDKKVVDRLRERGVDAIDLVVVTHHHTDHYGGMDDVIKAIRPRYFLASNSGHTTSMYLKLLDLVKQEQIHVIAPTASKPRKLLLGSVTLTILPQPPETKTSDENNNSIGIRVDFGSISALLTGDSEDDERKWWVENCPDLVRDCTILKLAHHGSRNGTDQAWLDLVRPEVSVASLGAGNDYGHPHSETLKLLERNDIPLLRTDQKGTIVIRTDGRRWQVDSKSMASRGKSSRSRDRTVDTVSADADDVQSTSRTKSASSRSRSDDSYDTASSSPNSKSRSTSRSGDTWSSKSSPSSSGRLVNVNTATRSELERLPGVGPSSAQKIIDNRPYRSMSDLRSVPGFNAAKLAQIEDLIDVR